MHFLNPCQLILISWQHFIQDITDGFVPFKQIMIVKKGFEMNFNYGFSTIGQNFYKFAIWSNERLVFLDCHSSIQEWNGLFGFFVCDEEQVGGSDLNLKGYNRGSHSFSHF